MKLAIVLIAMAVSIYWGVTGVNEVAEGRYGWGICDLLIATLWTVIALRQKRPA